MQLTGNPQSLHIWSCISIHIDAPSSSSLILINNKMGVILQAPFCLKQVSSTLCSRTSHRAATFPEMHYSWDSLDPISPPSFLLSQASGLDCSREIYGRFTMPKSAPSAIYLSQTCPPINLVRVQLILSQHLHIEDSNSTKTQSLE